MSENREEIDSSRQIKYGALMSYVALGINILAGFIYTPWIMHQIGSSEYGLYTIAISLIGMFVMDFGISSAIAKYVAEYRAKKQEDKINQLVSVSVQLYLIIDAVILVILLAIYPFLDVIYANFSAVELEHFRVVYVIVACFNVVAFPFIPLSGILTAYERFISLNVCEILNKVITIVLTVVALWNGMGLYALVSIKAIADLSMIVVKLYLVRRHTKISLNLRYRESKLFKDILTFSIWVTVMSVAQRLVINLVPSIIGAVLGATAAAIFGVAVTLENYSYSLGNVFSNMFLPRVSRVISEGNDREKMTDLMIKVGRIQFFIAALVSGGFFCAGRDFMLVWMGNEYIDAYYCACLLIIPKLFVYPLMIGTTALTALNKVKEHAMVNVGMALISLLFELILIGRFGIIGSAAAIGISYCFQAIAMAYLYQKFINIDLKRFVIEIYAKLLPILLLAVVVGLVENYYIDVTGWMTMAVEIIVIGISFLIIFYFGFLNKSEREAIGARIKRKR